MGTVKKVMKNFVFSREMCLKAIIRTVCEIRKINVDEALLRYYDFD